MTDNTADKSESISDSINAFIRLCSLLLQSLLTFLLQLRVYAFHSRSKVRIIGIQHNWVT